MNKVLCLFVFVAYVSTQSCYITISNLNLRNGASQNSGVIVQIPSGVTVTRIGNSEQNNEGFTWYNIDYRGTKGWSVTKYLSPTSCPGTPPSGGGGTTRYTLANRPRGPEFPVESVPTISPYLFDKVLRDAKSPALSQGFQSIDLYRAIKNKGINPAVALAFFEHESQLGREGIAQLGINNWGNLRPGSGGNLGRAYTTQNTDYGIFRKYRNYMDSALDFCELLLKDIYRGKSIRQVIQIYAPGSDGNNPAGYAAIVLRRIDRWNIDSGDFDAEVMDVDGSMMNPILASNRSHQSAAIIVAMTVVVVVLALAVLAVAMVYRNKRRQLDLLQPLATYEDTAELETI